MYDARRLKSIVTLFGVVLITLFATNFVLTVTTVIYPGLLPKQFFGVDFLVENRKRVLTAAAQYRNGFLTADDPLIVILGLSSASEGIALEQLSSPGAQIRYLGLVGAGRNMRDVRRYAQPLLDSNLQPQLVVFAINLFHLLDPPISTSGILHQLNNEPANTELRGQWFFNHRSDIKYAVSALLFDARNRVFKAFDVRLDETGTDPWREIVRMSLSQTVTEQQWQSNLRRYGERGYYNSDAYQSSTKQSATLVSLIKEMQAKRMDIMIVLMPEHSILRVNIPTTAMHTLTAPLRHTFGKQSPAIVDMRDDVPDTGFTDISHMNREGRRLFSSLLANVITEHLTPSQSERK